MNRIRIVMERHGVGKIEINGVELNGVKAILFRAKGGSLNLLRLDLIADEVEIVSEETEVKRSVEQAGGYV